MIFLDKKKVYRFAFWMIEFYGGIMEPSTVHLKLGLNNLLILLILKSHLELSALVFISNRKGGGSIASRVEANLSRSG